MTTRERSESVDKILRKADLYAEVYEHHSLPVVCVEINWGDWKHDHLRAEWLIKEAGGKKIACEVTEEDGSDTYSAIHYFTFS